MPYGTAKPNNRLLNFIHNITREKSTQIISAKHKKIGTKIRF